MDGSRRWPIDLSLVAFLSGVMRSLRDEHWKRHRRESLRAADSCPDPREDADPERVFASVQSLAELNRLFARDGAAIRILTGLAEGLTADEIRSTYELGPVEYDSARRRIRRLLVRQGLAWTGRWTDRRRPTLPVDVLLAALEAELITATDSEIEEVLEDAGLRSVAIDEVRDVLVSACGSEADDGDLPGGSPRSYREGLARH